MRVNVPTWDNLWGWTGETVPGFEVPRCDETLGPELSQPPKEVRWALAPRLAQIPVLLLRHSVDVLAPTVRPLLTFDPPPEDFLNLRDIFCPFGKDTLSNPMKAILVSGRALLEQTY